MIEIKRRYHVKEDIGVGLLNIKNTLNIYNTALAEQKIIKNIKPKSTTTEYVKKKVTTEFVKKKVKDVYKELYKPKD